MTNKSFALFRYFFAIGVFLFGFTVHAQPITSGKFLAQTKSETYRLLARAKQSAGKIDSALSARIGRLERRLSEVNLVLTSEGQCKANKNGNIVTGFVLMNRETGESDNTIYVCEQAVALMPPSETIIHELTHLSEGEDECNSTYMEMEIPLLVGRKPMINGYFQSCMAQAMRALGGNDAGLGSFSLELARVRKNELGQGGVSHSHHSSMVEARVSVKRDFCGEHDHGLRDASSVGSAI